MAFYIDQFCHLSLQYTRPSIILELLLFIIIIINNSRIMTVANGY